MPTLTQFRQQAAREVGRYFDGTAKSGSSTTTLVDTAWNVKSSLNQDDLYTDYYLFRPNAISASDRVRIVATYQPSSGYLIADQTWGIPPYSGGVGEAYELHGTVEPYEAMTRLLNAALKRCFIVVEVTMTPIADQTRHSLTTVAPWLTDPRSIVNVGCMQNTDDRDEVDPYAAPVRGEVVQDGATFYLVHRGRSFSASEQTIYLQAIKPAYYHCRAAGGVYGSQSGLSLESDECPVAVDWVAAGTLVEAWRDFGHLLEAAANQKLARDRQEAAAWFTRLSNDNFVPPIPRLRKAIMGWGPRQPF
jgi:hypothetical protein